MPAPEVTVVGLGDTGLACVRYLRRLGCQVCVTDTREAPPHAATLAVEHPEVDQALGGLDAPVLRHAGRVVLSPGVDPREPAIAEARAEGVEIIGEIELFARAADAPVVAITGSNGKTTVTRLVVAICAAAGRHVEVGGNIGTPALELLDRPTPELYVLELSSFQLEATLSLDACAAVVLNLSADHMDRYAGLADYGAAKARVYQGSGVVVVNGDDPDATHIAPVDRDLCHFALAPPEGAGDAGIATRDGQQWLMLGNQPVLPVADLALAGRHTQANALAAIALAGAAGLPVAAMAEALRGFAGLPHRMESLGEYAGRHWYNDSKATNVGATLAAVQGLQRPYVLIAGGQGKEQSFEPLIETLAASARGLVAIGECAGQLTGPLQGRLPTAQARDMASAVAEARAMSRTGDAVLLSPACASFDQFDGYAARGEAYRRAVQEPTP